MNISVLNYVLRKTGERFCQYIINYSGEIRYDQNQYNLNFTSNQINAINAAYLILVECEKASIYSNSNHFKNNLYHFCSDFNALRENCEGFISQRVSSNELLSYLYEKARIYYPLLLISESIDYPYYSGNVFSIFPYSIEEGELVSKLIRNHPQLNKIIRSNRICYRMSDNSCVVSSMNDFIGNYISRSFLNCCYRMKYTLEDLYSELETSMKVLEDIASGNEVEVSFFAGIKGMKLEQSDYYYFDDNVCFRNADSTSNPTIHETISIATTESHSQTLIGGVLEYKIQLKSLGVINNEDYPINRDFSWYSEILNNIQMACILTLQSASPLVSISFIDFGFPISRKFHQPIEFSPSGILILNDSSIVMVKKWFLLLNKVDINYFSVTLERIKSSIYSRSNLLDSILDAFISWESMFSSKISTTNSVINSFIVILRRSKSIISEKELKKELNNLYSIRSAIAHGNPNKHKSLESNDPENPHLKKEQVKNRVIEIAIIVLKELLLDYNLCNMTAEQRVKILLNPKLEECKECNTKKYSFS